MLSRRHTALALSTLLWSGGLAWASGAGLRDFLDLRVVRPFELYTRALLGREPPVDPRLKLISLDDKTAASLGDNRLPAGDLVVLLRAIATARPAAILIDALFSSDSDLSVADIDALASLRDVPTRLAAGAAVSNTPIGYRTELPPSALAGNWTALSGPPVAGPGHVYGPAAAYQPIFDQIGHVVLTDTLHVAPTLSLRDGNVIPHMALLAATDRRVGPGRIEVDGVVLPVDSRGRVPIDFVTPTRLADYSMGGLLAKARAGKPIQSIKEGDVVVILLNATTGSTDFYDSPLGRIRGGHILAANVNSTLRGSWLRQIEFDWVFILLAAVLGHVVGLWARATWFWPLFGGVIAAGLAAMTFSFTYLGWVIPAAMPVIGGMVPALATYAYRRHQDSQRHMRLQLDVATAATLQRHFFPPPLVESERYELAAYYHPAEAIGGDWFAYYADRDHLTVHIGDVTGHGTPAALVASFAKGATDMIHADYAKRGAGHPPLRQVHENLNDMIRAGIGELAFMTMFSVSIDLTKGEVHYLNSGHRPGLLVSATQKGVSMFTPNESTILGLAPLKPGKARTLPLAADATLLLLSDGLIDVPKALGVHVSESRLRGQLTTGTAATMRERILKDSGLQDAAASTFVDDVTFIVLKIKSSS